VVEPAVVPETVGVVKTRKDVARALRAIARKLDPPPGHFDDYDEEYAMQFKRWVHREGA
jgi:hypothetical protein